MSPSRPTTAMVLAAGRGQRMRPLSDTLPKPALPLPGGPLVAWAMRQATASGAHRMVVNSWHLAPLMEEAIRSIIRYSTKTAGERRFRQSIIIAVMAMFGTLPTVTPKVSVL